MSDTVDNAGVETPVVPEQPENTGISGVSDEQLKAIEEVIGKKLEERYKPQVSGLDKKVTDYQNMLKAKELELEDIRKTSMSQQQLKEYELEKKAQQLEDITNEINQKNQKLWKMESLNEYKLDNEALDFINGNEEVEVRKKAEGLSNYINRKVHEQIEALKKGGIKPGIGSTPAPSEFTSNEDVRDGGKQVQALLRAGKKDEAQALLEKIHNSIRS